jgi:hypothetical protein
MSAGKTVYAGTRCLGHRFIVAGPVDYCAGCGLAIAPMKGGLLLPRRKNGQLYCSAAPTP